ncbi:MAG TPA: AraC family transcriptional regulator [Clostridiales bacterium]|nr:AraC family transcriptional regulator [Clostridiales bacterium]
MATEYEFVRGCEGMPFKIFFVSIGRRLYHWHNELELIMPLEGSVVVNTFQKRNLLKKGDLFLLNSNEIHSLTGTEEANQILALQIQPRFCKEYYPQFQRVRFLQHRVVGCGLQNASEEIRKHMAKMMIDFSKKEEGYQFKLMERLNRIIYMLVKYVPHELIEQDKLSSQEKNLVRLNKIINYIKENYMCKLLLKDIAKLEGVSMFYLSHFIKENLGISFQQYLNKVRLEKAAMLLSQGNRKILDVCVECGFSDYRYLNRLFYKEYGIMPSQYRLQRKNIKPDAFSKDLSKEHLELNEKSALQKLISLYEHQK